MRETLKDTVVGDPNHEAYKHRTVILTLLVRFTNR